ncbi:MAG: hypothetical protein J6A85_03690 [Clostridia bacterium]|nr:hypothetical protein [Clostridia bacterium]
MERKTQKNTAKTLIIAIFALFAVLAVICGLFLVLFNMNGFILKGFETDFEETVKAEGYEILETKSVYGKLNGNGNGINYFSAVLIKADENEIEALEEALEEKHEISGYYKQEGLEIATVYNEHAPLEYETALNESETYYTVYVFESHISGSNPLDPKGH